MCTTTSPAVRGPVAHVAALAVAFSVAPRSAAAGTIRTPGMDVSSYQGTINWTSVKAAGIKFAFVRASTGTVTTDSTFATNMSAAKQAGILTGAYHFSYPQNSGHTPAAEASHFLSIAKPYIVAGRLQPVLDVEQGGGGTVVGATSLTAWANAWCAAVKTATGVDPLVYCNTNYARNYLTSAITTHKLWVANYNAVNPDSGSTVNGVWGTSWSAYQYSSSGSVGGITGNVDRDWFNGSEAGLGAITIQAAVPEPAAVGLAAAAGLGLLGRRRRERRAYG